MILELTRGHIRMRVDDKTVTIECEGYLPGHGPPDFDVFADSIVHWDPPNTGKEIDQATREKILRLLQEEMAKKHLTINIQ